MNIILVLNINIDYSLKNQIVHIVLNLKLDGVNKKMKNKKLVKVYIRDLRFDIPDVSLEKVEQLYQQLQWSEARDSSVREVIKKIQTLQKNN